MNILKFLDQIVNLLFYPVFSLLIGGVVLMTLTHIHRRGRMFYAVLLGTVWLLAWRCFVTLLSKRYSDILLYVGIGFTAAFLYHFPPWLCCRFRPLGRRFPAAWRLLRGNLRTLSRLMLLIVLGVSLGKYFCYNRFHAALPNLCAIVRADAETRHGAIVIDGCGEARRIGFYTGLPVRTLSEDASQEKRFREVRSILRKRRATVYWVCKEGHGPPLAAAQFGVKPQEWERLYSTCFNNRKNAVLSVYRCRKPAKQAKPRPAAKKKTAQ